MKIWYKNLLEYYYLADLKLANTCTTIYELENDLVTVALKWPGHQNHRFINIPGDSNDYSEGLN